MNWYVIQTKPKKEEEATSYLSINRLEVFNPLIETFIFKDGKMVRVPKSLFPNYIFAKFDFYQSYALVKWARGVKKILGFGEYPTPVSEEIIEIIKERLDSQGIARMEQPFKINDVVRIKSGPLKDLLGVFERWASDSERVRILLNLIGYQPAIEVHYSMIEKVA